MSIALNASRFTESLSQVKFSAPINAMVGWLTSVQGSDLTYHRVRQEKWNEFTKITSYAKPAYDITITPKQYSAIKQVLTARDVLQVPQEAMLLFDVVLQELWAQTDVSLSTSPGEITKQFSLPPAGSIATIQDAERALTQLDEQEAAIRQEIAKRRSNLEQQYSLQKQTLKTKPST